ncbi:MAG TPA: hypothetical protein VMA83_08935 [Solirubrobacteraceae bacterium]|nr:hypothetical protein [Solirubrobacteraceae bacterium]
MKRLTGAWAAMTRRQRHAAIAAVGLLVTMFLPWYSLQSVDRHTGTIETKTISAFGDVSFVEAAIFLVAAGVLVMLFARAEGRRFHLPGGDGAIVMLAGLWAALLIFYRVFDRPEGGGNPVGIEWGFFLAFIAAGALAYTGWRMRAAEAPQSPVVRPRHEEPPAPPPRPARPAAERRRRPASVAAPAQQLSLDEEPQRPRFPPAPPREG